MSLKSLLSSCAVAAGLACFGAPLAVAETPDLAAAKALVDRHASQPAFVPPGPSFDAPGCMKGKKMLSIPVSSTIPFAKFIVNAEKRTAGDIGFEVMEWENQGQPSQWAQGMEYAINNKFDAVDLLVGTDAALLGPQIERARKAGVQVFASHTYDITQTPDPRLDHALKAPYHDVGVLLANWVTLDSKGSANVLVISSDEQAPSIPYVNAFKETLAKVCGAGCKVSVVNAPVPEWATKIQPSVQAALIADPTIDYIVPIFDSMAQFALPAIKITGRKGSVKIASFNGTPFVLDAIQKGDVAMDIGESLGWLARSVLDGDMRKLCHLASYDDLYVPLYIFDAHNAKDAGTPASFDTGYGGQDVPGYKALWQLK